MANGFNATDFSDADVLVLTEDVADPDLGITGQKQYVGVIGGAGSTNKLAIDSAGRAKVDASGVPVPVTDDGGTLSIDDGGGSITVDVADGQSVALGATTDAEASAGNGSLIAIVKRLRTLLNGGLPAALGGSGGLKTEIVSGIAASRTSDSIAAALATDVVMNGLTALTPVFAPITASASGATTVVNGVASKKIRVLGLFLVCAGAVNVNLQSHTTTATKTGVLPFGANGGINTGFWATGFFETVAGEALDIDLGGAVAVGGQLVYVAV